MRNISPGEVISEEVQASLSHLLRMHKEESQTVFLKKGPFRN